MDKLIEDLNDVLKKSVKLEHIFALKKTINILKLIRDCDETSATKCFTCINEIKKEVFKMDNSEKQKWIPVSEKLPEEGGNYLTTILLSNNYPHVSIRSFTNNLYEVDDYAFYDRKGISGWFEYDSEYGFFEDENVIAWMPLPKPYKEEQ